jgi:hypothetical protein
MDPLIFIIIFLFLLRGAGSGILLYLIMRLLMPEKKNSETITDEEVKNSDFKEKVEEKVEEFNEVINNHFNKKSMKKNKGIFWGLLLVAIGLLWLGRTFGLFHFSWYNFARLWPLLIILIGVKCLPIEQTWKNVCSVIILALAIVLLFVLPTRSCHHHYWWNDKYVIKKKNTHTECYVENEDEDDLDFDGNETITVSVDSGVITINQEKLEDGETKVVVKKIKL